MPMLASVHPGRPGISGGSAGFSRNETMRPSASISITPKPFASGVGTSRQATVTSAPELTCCTSMRS